MFRQEFSVDSFLKLPTVFHTGLVDAPAPQFNGEFRSANVCNINIETITRPSVDGGRDAIGTYRLGAVADRISLDFALEAKCYAPENGVGVKELSGLISRLRHREFGILVTTSFLGHQAYQELRSDRHPVIVIAGADIAAILVKAGIGTPEALGLWLSQFRLILLGCAKSDSLSCSVSQ